MKSMKERALIDIKVLKHLEPIASLSDERLQELIPLVYVEQLPIGGNLFREGDLDSQAVYLLAGSVQLTSSDGGINHSVNEKLEEARFPLDDSQPRQASCSALSRVEVLRIDNSVLDYMMMWDQMAVSEDQPDDEPPSVPPPEPETAAAKETDEAGAVQGQAEVSEAEAADNHAQEPIPGPDASEGSGSQQAPAPETPAVQAVAVTQAAENETGTSLAGAEEETTLAAEDVKETSQAVPTGEDRSWIRKMRHIMAFKSMPPANIKRLLEKMESIEVSQGDTVIQQGEPGEYYYVLTEGEAEVTRAVKLADLEPGRSFGEEALLAGSRRNATVTMKSDGIVMRLSKKDFNQLLQEPLLNRVSPAEAKLQVAEGAVWLDVRHAREYHHSHLPESMNLPLHELRMRMHELDVQKPLICYCSTGRRSAAAAFLLVQKGFNASVLNGGVKVMAQDLVRET